MRVIANAKRNEVIKEADLFKVYLNAPAVEGKANKALIGVLADYLAVKKSQISILKGAKNRFKIVEIT